MTHDAARRAQPRKTHHNVEQSRAARSVPDGRRIVAIERAADNVVAPRDHEEGEGAAPAILFARAAPQSARLLGDRHVHFRTALRVLHVPRQRFISFASRLVDRHQ